MSTTITETSSLKLSSTLSIKSGRLVKTIHETANAFGAKYQWGPNATTDTGVCRLTLTDYDKGVRDWFIKEVKSLGCEVTIDDIGNIFATYAGEKEGKPTAIGSHLDTQPTGGRYDGILGVLSGLEVLRIMKENNYKPKYPIVLIDWCNEEGARFPTSLMGSGVWCGAMDKQEIYNLKSVTDEKQVKVIDELERIGYRGDIPSSYKNLPIAAHFELHIEQGPILENEGKRAGVVVGVQAYEWNKITVRGKAQHTGTTPINLRSDPSLAASKMIVKANEIAVKYGGLASVGIITAHPGVVNVIPEAVSFVLDTRHTHDEHLKAMLAELKSEFQEISKGSAFLKCSVEWENMQTQAATHFDQTCIKCVKESGLELFGAGNIKEMVSGAGHDSCSTVSAGVPTAMIFIPSKGGVSHNPEEYSTPEECDDGLQMLLSAVIKYDQLRAE